MLFGSVEDTRVELQITSLCLYFLLMKTFTQVISMGRWWEYHSACIYIYYTFLHDYTCRSGTILTWDYWCLLSKYNFTCVGNIIENQISLLLLEILVRSERNKDLKKQYLAPEILDNLLKKWSNSQYCTWPSYLLHSTVYFYRSHYICSRWTLMIRLKENMPLMIQSSCNFCMIKLLIIGFHK